MEEGLQGKAKMRREYDSMFVARRPTGEGERVVVNFGAFAPEIQQPTEKLFY